MKYTEMSFYLVILALAATTCKEMSSLATTTNMFTTRMPTPPATDMTTATKATECVDVFHHCAAFNTTACDANHQSWAKKYCAKYCNLCDDSCVDKEPNCETYGLAACQTAFSSWATKNCARFCGICINAEIPTPPASPDALPSRAGCHDVQDCNAYSRDVCTDYAIWARQHCASYCGFCT
ncbi:uncharacterized protein LOC110450081 isoform X2 [Mizuhopecten yessoensis]|uniref:uncharacterized protein LOC110450081 isoform X2 n=1 Tax=Mizuhopecten yessoensis TaxID=6573 RepID=UPI000B45B749|nr:uncharacterized protein LOC110450081 isoform X2 [Mizuhopecten yessoensis]